jgi:hypothetical protein
VENVIIPSPPAWNKIKMTNLPNGEKWLPVSLTVNPVTQVALVAVKRLSMTGILPSSCGVAKGKDSMIVPRTMAHKKLTITSCGGVNLPIDLIRL